MSSVESENTSLRQYRSDIFLRVAMTILPIAAVVSYQIDSILQWKFQTTYAGLSSTVLNIFYYLQFYSHLKYSSDTLRTVYLVVYHTTICGLKIGGDMVYLLYHHRENSLFNEIVFVIRIIQDVVFIIVVCFYKIRYYEPLICIQHKALFSVISRLEVILAILVPIFSQEKLVQRTVANISLFILYDFFSEYYALFTLRLKSALWLFVVFISISVVHEWLYFVNREWRLCDNMSIGFELLAEMACCLVIVWQFELPYNSPDSPIISPV